MSASMVSEMAMVYMGRPFPGRRSARKMIAPPARGGKLRAIPEGGQSGPNGPENGPGKAPNGKLMGRETAPMGQGFGQEWHRRQVVTCIATVKGHSAGGGPRGTRGQSGQSGQNGTRNGTRGAAAGWL